MENSGKATKAYGTAYAKVINWVLTVFHHNLNIQRKTGKKNGNRVPKQQEDKIRTADSIILDIGDTSKDNTTTDIYKTATTRRKAILLM